MYERFYNSTRLDIAKREEALHRLPIGHLNLQKIEGHVTLYNHSYEVNTGITFTEVVLPGALDSFLESNSTISIPMKINHAESLAVPGRLRVFSDWEGLAFEAYLADSEISRNLNLALRHGYLTGVSPHWRCLTEDRGDHTAVIKVLQIHELSFCDFPAQIKTICGFPGRVKLNGPSPLGPLLPSEAARLQKFLDYVGSETTKRPRPFVQPKPAALKKIKTKTHYVVPASEPWRRVGCKAFE